MKSWLLPRSCGGLVLAFFLLSLLCAALVYSFRDDMYRTYLGLQPAAQNVGKAAYTAGEKPGVEKTAGGARVTLNSIYAEERYVVVGYEVEDLTDGRRVGEHPAELQPLIGFGTPKGRELEYRREHDLGTSSVDLTDESGASFRMVNNSGQVSEGPNNMGRGPMQNMAAFEADKELDPGEEHRFRFEVPLVESPVVPMGQRRPPPEPFAGGPFVFDLETSVEAVRVLAVGQKDTAGGVALTLERITDSPGRPEAVVCLESRDGVRGWYPAGEDLAIEEAPSPVAGKGDCLQIPLSRPLDGPSSITITQIETDPAEDGQVIQGPWTFEFDVPDS